MKECRQLKEENAKLQAENKTLREDIRVCFVGMKQVREELTSVSHVLDCISGVVLRKEKPMSVDKETPSLKESVPFEKGDVVILKSGGPAMTIVAIEDSDTRCTWIHMTPDGVFSQMHAECFPAVCLLHHWSSVKHDPENSNSLLECDQELTMRLYR